MDSSPNVDTFELSATVHSRLGEVVVLRSQDLSESPTRVLLC